MTLVVGIGLKSFYADEARRADGVAAFVEAGCTDLVHEVFGEPEALDTVRVLRVERTVEGVERRWLGAVEAEPLLHDMSEVYKKHSTYASFAWNELDRIGAFDVQPFALVVRYPNPVLEITLPHFSERMRVVHVDYSLRNWRSRSKQSIIAAALHKLARRQRFIVHSG